MTELAPRDDRSSPRPRFGRVSVYDKGSEKEGKNGRDMRYWGLRS